MTFARCYDLHTKLCADGCRLILFHGEVIVHRGKWLVKVRPISGDRPLGWAHVTSPFCSKRLLKCLSCPPHPLFWRRLHTRHFLQDSVLVEIQNHEFSHVLYKAIPPTSPPTHPTRIHSGRVIILRKCISEAEHHQNRNLPSDGIVSSFSPLPILKPFHPMVQFNIIVSSQTLICYLALWKYQCLSLQTVQRDTLGCNCRPWGNSSLPSLCYHLPPTRKLSLSPMLSSVARISCWPLHTVTTAFFLPIHRHSIICHPTKQCAVNKPFRFPYRSLRIMIAAYNDRLLSTSSSLSYRLPSTQNSALLHKPSS